MLFLKEMKKEKKQIPALSMCVEGDNLKKGCGKKTKNKSILFVLTNIGDLNCNMRIILHLVLLLLRYEGKQGVK